MTASDSEPAPAQVAAPARRHLTVAARLDEAARPLHEVSAVKAVLHVIAAATATLVLPWPVCLAWLALGLSVELWAWFATRHWPPEGKVTPRRRANFAASYVSMNLSWLLFAAMLWSTGTAEGHAAAAALVMIVVTVTIMLFWNTALIFLAAGSAPAVAAFAVIAADDGRDWRLMAPIWMTLALGAFFSLGRALDTPSAQEHQRRLNDSLRKFETLAENVTDVIARTDLDGQFQYVSPAAYAVLGYRPEELVGTSRWALAHPDADRTQLAAAFERMIADPSRSEVATVRARHKDGRWLWLQSSARLILENGVPVAVIDACRDVTAQVAADALLREAKAEAESATRAKADFLANVSHEIRTPMNGVLGALHLLEREDISPEGRELMRRANDCGRMLSQLLNDVLDFSKIEAGQLDLSPEPMNVAEALRAVVGLLDGEARAKGVELRCEVTGADLWIEGDPVRLRQAMFNLVGNAVKFTSDGHVAARLSVTETPGGRLVRLEVEDTGIGMSPDAQGRLFERFHQAESDTARRFGGAGLGLSISRALARMMGGDIGFTSVAGHGSTFWLTFDAPAAEAVSVQAVEDGLLAGVAILLVEDNPTNRLVARTMLTRLGADVQEAEDGVAGLEAARTGVHDLILMDIQMPHMGGIEATRAIRGLKGPAAQVPILALTANAMVHQRAEYLAAGMNGVVAKPISAAALLTEIARLTAEEEAQATA